MEGDDSHTIERDTEVPIRPLTRVGKSWYTRASISSQVYSGLLGHWVIPRDSENEPDYHFSVREKVRSKLETSYNRTPTTIGKMEVYLDLLFGGVFFVFTCYLIQHRVTAANWGLRSDWT